MKCLVESDEKEYFNFLELVYTSFAVVTDEP